MKVVKSLIFLGIISFFILRDPLPPGPGPNIDPQLEQAWQAWLSDMDSMNFDLKYKIGNISSIQVSDTLNRVAGVSNKRRGVILIAQYVIDRGAESIKYSLYHELGHHVFNFNHSSKNSIMYRSIIPSDQIKSNWTELKSKYLLKCKKSYDRAPLEFR